MGLFGEDGKLKDLMEGEEVSIIRKKLELTSILLPWEQNVNVGIKKNSSFFSYF
jgi:hypothetical protein